MTENTSKISPLLSNISKNIRNKINKETKEDQPSPAEEEVHEEKRSAGAVVAERILRAVNDGHLSSVEDTEKFLEKRASVEDKPLKLAKSRLSRGNGDLLDFLNIQVVCFGDNKTASDTVLYLHGGGYAEEITPFHLNFCANLAEQIGAFFLVPIYPLAPNHIWKETFDILTELYKVILMERNGSITIMGDSAGGGLSIAFCQYLKTIYMVQPNHLIGLSPWVDACMEDTDYEPYRPLDPLLDVSGLQTYAKAWAGDLDLRDPKISPIFGDNHGLPKTLLFTGTREILYPDICKFYEKMKQDCVDVDLVIGEGMNHVYPLYGLPESKNAIARIVKEIKG